MPFLLGARKELDDLISSIKKVAKGIQQKLKGRQLTLIKYGTRYNGHCGGIKDFKIEIERARKDNPTSAEPRIREMQYETLTRNFVDVMVECNAIQDEHRQRCKERFQRQLEIGNR